MLWATIPGSVFVVCVCVFTQVGMERHNTLNICHSQSSRFRGIGCSVKLVVYLEMEIAFSVVVLKCLSVGNLRRASYHKGRRKKTVFLLSVKKGGGPRRI